MEVARDAHVYDTGMITVIEMHGPSCRLADRRRRPSPTRAALARDFIYLPEVDFDMDKFLADVYRDATRKTASCIVAVSEGIHYADGKFVSEAKISGHRRLRSCPARWSGSAACQRR